MGVTQANDYVALKLSSLASVQTSSNLGIALNGSVPFSIDAWVKFDGLSASGGILTQADSFTFGITSDSMVLQIPGYPMATSSPSTQPVEEDSWQYLCVTYQAGQVRFYINGQFNSFTSVFGNGSTNANPFVIGQTMQSVMRGVRVYNVALDPDTVLDNMYNPPDPSTIVADFDFTQSPPVDNGGGHLPLSLRNGAKMITYTPALGLGATAFAQPLRDEDVNPGGQQVDPYTVQSWIYVSSSEVPLQTIFVNSDLESDTGMALYLTYDNTAKAFHAVSVRGSNNVAGNLLVSNGTVPLDRWVNVATTFDGTTLALYINAVLDNSAELGPIAMSRNDGLPLIGAAYVQGRPGGGTSLQGFISVVEVWRTARTAEELAADLEAYPEPQTPGLAALYDFTAEAPYNLVNGHAIALASGAMITSQESPALHSAPKTTAPSSETVEPLDDATIEELRRSIDFSAERDRIVAAFEQSMASAVALAGGDREREERIRAKWTDTLEKLRSDPLSMSFLVTRHRHGGEDILLLHTHRGTEVAYRAAAGSFDDCTMWKVQLFFVLIAGILDAVFGLSARLSTKSIAYIVEILSKSWKLTVLLAAGTLITASQVIEACVELYKLGMLKELLKMILEIGFWAIVRIFTKLVLTILGVGYVDLIASLAATVATFIVVFLQRPSACDPPTNVALAAIKFDYDPTNTAIEALAIRRNYTTDIPVPEWVKGKTLPQESPAAYSIAKVSGKTITIQAKFTITTNDSTRATISASGGGILGAIPAFTVNFRNGVSVPEFVTISLPSHLMATGGVKMQDIQWSWSYAMGGVPTTHIATTSHRIYAVLDTPSGWTQGGRSDTQLPWTDVLDYACVWAAGSLSATAAAAAVTQKVFGAIGLTYDQVQGASAYTDFSSAYSLWTFLCSDFVDYLRTGGGRGNTVNCTDCAAIVTAFSNIIGCNLASGVMAPTDGQPGFMTNQIIAIGSTTWAYPFGIGNFSYHEVAFTGAMSYANQLNDACLQVDGGSNPWNWSSPPASPHVPDLPDPVQFTTQGMTPPLPIATPFTSPSYRERLCTNNAAGIYACVPLGARPKSNGGRRRNQ